MEKNRPGSRFSKTFSTFGRNSRNRFQLILAPLDGILYGLNGARNSMVMVSSIFDRPVMTNEWPGVVKNLKEVDIGHVLFDQNV